MKNLIENKFKKDAAVEFTYSKTDIPENISTAVIFFADKLVNYLRKQRFTEKRNLFYKDGINVVFCFIQAPGAPFTIIKCDELRKKGIKEFIILGMAAGIGNLFNISDILLVRSSLIGEGTSHNYIDERKNIVNSSEFLNKKILGLFIEQNITCRYVNAWTTDAPLRETYEEIELLEKKGINCIDMECSALFSFCEHFKDIESSAVFVVSDLFKDSEYKCAFNNKEVFNALCYLCDILSCL
jgi:purine-nucleoside phosphorylase